MDKEKEKLIDELNKPMEQEEKKPENIGKPVEPEKLEKPIEAVVEPVETADGEFIKIKFNWKRSLLTAFFVLLSAGVVGGLTWYIMNKNANDINGSNNKTISAMQANINNLEAQITSLEKITTKSTGVTSTTGKLTYQNTQYGFGLTLPSDWAGYTATVRPADSAGVVYIDFSMTTTDSTWINQLKTNKASIFSVGIFTQAQWTTDQQAPEHSTYLGESSKYTFGYSKAQDLPADLASKAAEVPTIIATYKSL